MASDKVKSFTLKGLVSAPCTPFKPNGDVNLDLIPQYVQHFLDFSNYNAFVTGTTGEGNSMTLEERKAVAETWVQAGRGRLSAVIVHVGANNLRDSQELARHAEQIGADGIACVGPTYHKPETLEQYVYYMRDVAAEAPNTPFFLYDIDFVTGIPYLGEDFFRLAPHHIPTLRGLKHTSESLISMGNILGTYGNKYQVMMGTDEYFLEGLALGLEITMGSTFLGNVHQRMKEAFDRGDLKEARLEQYRAQQVANIRKKYKFSIPGGAKATLRALGMSVGDPRCPLEPISDEKVAMYKDDLAAIGFFDWALKK